MGIFQLFVWREGMGSCSDDRWPYVIIIYGLVFYGDRVLCNPKQEEISLDNIFISLYDVNVTHTEKKNILEKLVVIPDKGKRNFWGREMQSLNILIEKYPEDFFWKGLTFDKKFDSIIVLRSGYYSEELEKKYKRFIYVIPKSNNIKIGEKQGEDYVQKNKRKTLRDFLS
jgi:hypothetical protein